MAKINTTDTNTDTDDKKGRKAARLALEARNADPFESQRDALKAMMDELDELSCDRDLTTPNRKAAIEFAEALESLISANCAEPEPEEEAD